MSSILGRSGVKAPGSIGVAALVPGLEGIEFGQGKGLVARRLGSRSSHGGVVLLRSDLDRLEDPPFLTAVPGNPAGSRSDSRGEVGLYFGVLDPRDDFDFLEAEALPGSRGGG